MNYLLVDDDAVFSSVLIKALTRHGSQVVTATDGHQATVTVENSTLSGWCWILNLSGNPGLSILQNSGYTVAVEVVILTGYSSISTAVEAIKQGATNYLCKPAGADEIIAAFEETGSDVPLQESPRRSTDWVGHIQRVLNENDGNISATARKRGNAPQNPAAQATRNAGEKLK